PNVFHLADVFSPKFFAVEVITDHARRAEASNDAFAVGNRRSGAKRVGRVCGFLVGVGHLAVPKYLAIGSAKTHQTTTFRQSRSTATGWRPVRLVCCLRDEHAVAPDNGAGIALIEEGHLPANVLGRAPLQWGVTLRRNAISLGPAPGRPISRPAWQGETENAGKRANEWSHRFVLPGNRVRSVKT